MDSGGNDPGFDQCFCHGSAGETMEKNSSGFTNKLYPQGGAFSEDLLDQKSKSPLLPGVGAWYQMTSG